MSSTGTKTSLATQRWVREPQIVQVGPHGSESSIADALASITDASESNQYTIQMGSSLDEPGLTWKDWVSLDGQSHKIAIEIDGEQNASGLKLDGLTSPILLKDFEIFYSLQNIQEAQSWDEWNAAMRIHRCMGAVKLKDVSAFNRSQIDEFYDWTKHASIAVFDAPIDIDNVVADSRGMDVEFGSVGIYLVTEYIKAHRLIAYGGTNHAGYADYNPANMPSPGIYAEDVVDAEFTLCKSFGGTNPSPYYASRKNGTGCRIMGNFRPIESLLRGFPSVDYFFWPSLVTAQFGHALLRDCFAFGGVGVYNESGLQLGWLNAECFDVKAIGGDATNYAPSAGRNMEGINCSNMGYLILNGCKSESGKGTLCSALTVLGIQSLDIIGGEFKGYQDGYGCWAYDPTNNGRFTAFPTDAAMPWVIWNISFRDLRVDTGPALTLDVGTTPGGSDIYNDININMGGLLGSKLADIAAGGYVYVTPSIAVDAGRIYVHYSYCTNLANCRALNLDSHGRIRAYNARFSANRASDAVRIEAGTLSYADCRFEHCTFETMDPINKKSVNSASVWNGAPFYQCVFRGPLANVTPAAGTTRGTNVEV